MEYNELLTMKIRVFLVISLLRLSNPGRTADE